MGQQLARPSRRRLGWEEDVERLAFKPFGGWNYSYSKDYQRNCSFIIWAAVTAGSLAVDWREAALVLGGSLWAQETIRKTAREGNGASWVHNVQAGYLLYHVYFRNNRRLLPLLGVLAEAVGDVGAVVQEYVLEDEEYGHYAHAEGLAVGLAAGWLLDRFIKKKISLL